MGPFFSHGRRMVLEHDLLHPYAEVEARKHKLKRLVQHPNSFFMDVKCPGRYRITTIFSHAHTVVVCSGCSSVLCHPTGGRTKLTEGECSSHEAIRNRDFIFRMCFPKEKL